MPEPSRERLRESWDLTRADLLARLGRIAEVDAALARADQQVGNEGVRAFIARKRAALVEGST